MSDPGMGQYHCTYALTPKSSIRFTMNSQLRRQSSRLCHGKPMMKLKTECEAMPYRLVIDAACLINRGDVAFRIALASSLLVTSAPTRRSEVSGARQLTSSSSCRSTSVVSKRSLSPNETAVSSLQIAFARLLSAVKLSSTTDTYLEMKRSLCSSAARIAPLALAALKARQFPRLGVEQKAQF